MDEETKQVRTINDIKVIISAIIADMTFANNIDVEMIPEILTDIANGYSTEIKKQIKELN